MILLSSITIPMSNWVWLSAGIFIIIFILLIWTYKRAQAVHRGNKIAFLLKLVGVLILLLCLIEPLWNGRKPKSGENLFVIMADNSSGMNIHDQDMRQSRAEILKELVDVNNSQWIGDLAEDFQIRQYIFDSRLSRTSDFSNLVFDGKASSIGTTLRTIADRYRNRPLAGVLLLTDGIATDITDQSYDLSNMPPVYPVVIGGKQPQKDISIKNVTISQTAFEDSPVTIQADIETSGYSGKTIVADLLDEEGKLVERQTQNIGRDEQKKNFQFKLRPEETGILFYNLEVKERDEEATVASDAPTEATMANNRRTLVVDRGQGPYRILYVSGRPNWEYKFLRRAISEDEQVELVALMRVARREPKFNWIGRSGERTNPLYRGFENTDEEQTEEYDQPVLIRLNTLDSEELHDGFPITEEDLFKYQAIILDDIESEFFTPVQMDLIRRFVSKRGGGFMMLGGKESFQQGGYDRTAIGQILPLYLDKIPERPTAGKLFLNLTREGWLQPWARLRDNEIDEKQRLSEMTDFRVLNRLPSVKPGAQVIASIANEWAQEFPALVVQRFGNGRTAAMTIGDLWRWGMKESDMHEDMDKFWRQTLRWLIADVPERITLQAIPEPEQANQPVTLKVKVYDTDYEPMDNITVTAEVLDSQYQQTRLTAEPVLNESGTYEATYIPRTNGGYLARATVTDSEKNEIGNAETGWATDLEAIEFQSIKTNRPLLEKIAQQTGGRVLELNDLKNFSHSLLSENAPITETWIRPLWDLRGISPIIFFAVLLFFIGEWALRRWKGMP